MWFVRNDLIKLLNQNLDYLIKIINQSHSNYIMFKKSTTKNIMDYDNTRLVYLSNQIRIMRGDMQNYVDVVVEKPKPKKK
jgi:catabolite regulation protein CreA